MLYYTYILVQTLEIVKVFFSKIDYFIRILS